MFDFQIFQKSQGGQLLPLVLLLAFSLTITGCGSGGGGGGSGSSGEPEEDVVTGVLLDSQVAGVGYSTPTRSGVTGADGGFEYREGEVVQFKLGDLSLGALRGEEIVTPIELAGAFSLNDDTAVNIAQLLQTLDTDGDPTNGVDLPDNLDLPQGTDLSDEVSILTALGNYDSAITSLVDDMQAQRHLKSTLEDVEHREFANEYSQLQSTHNSNATGCSAATVSAMEVTRNSDGTYTLDAAIELDGTEEVLSGDIPNPYLSTSATDGTLYTSSSNTPVDIKVNEKKSILRWGDYGNQAACYGGVMLSAEDGVNVEPEAFDGHVVEEICYEGQEQSITKHFGGRDRDGYIQGPGKLKVSGANEVVASSTYTGSDVTAVGTLDYASTYPYGTWRLAQTFDTFTIKRDCSQPVTWEYTVTDNEGAAYTISGEIGSQGSDGDSSTGQYGSATLKGISYGIEDASYDSDSWIDGKFTTQKYGVMYFLVYQGSGDALFQDYSDPGTYQLVSQYDEDSEVNHEGPRVTVNSKDDSADWAVVDGSVTITDKGSENLVEISGTLVKSVIDGTGTSPRASQGTFEATVTVPK